MEAQKKLQRILQEIQSGQKADIIAYHAIKESEPIGPNLMAPPQEYLHVELVPHCLPTEAILELLTVLQAFTAETRLRYEIIIKSPNPFGL